MVAPWELRAVAIALPVIALALLTAARPPSGRRLPATLAVVAGVVVTAILPIGWSIDVGALAIAPPVAASVWTVPIELVVGLAGQALVVGLLVWRFDPVSSIPEVTRWHRATGALAGVAITAIGVVGWALSWPVVGVVLAWAGPLLGLAWAVHWPVLWQRRRTVAWAIVLPSVYWWLIEWVAVRWGLALVQADRLAGPTLWGLPIAVALGILATSAVVAQAVVLVDAYAS